MADDETARVMTSLGGRLRAIRQARGLTLAQLGAATGISVSTLSRLESGQREPGLRHLLPLARAHRLPLDELVGSRTGDPRVHPRPFTRHGQTWLPLTRNPNDGLHAYKQILPAPPTARTEWTRGPNRAPTRATSGSTSSPDACSSPSATTTSS